MKNNQTRDSKRHPSETGFAFGNSRPKGGARPPAAKGVRTLMSPRTSDKLLRMPFSNRELKLNKPYDFTIGNSAIYTTVFIHGIAGEAADFAELFDFLKEQKLGMRVVAYDLLGAGGSPSGEGVDFGYIGQLAALKNSLDEIAGPVVLVGHSMGTLIATRFAVLYPEKVSRLILVSPPVYTAKDLANPEMTAAVESFREQILAKDTSKINNMEAFNEEMRSIVLDPKNYDFLTQVPCRTNLIYGKKDQIIASFNIPQVLQANSLISAVETAGGHSVREDKFPAILDALESVGTEVK